MRQKEIRGSLVIHQSRRYRAMFGTVVDTAKLDIPHSSRRYRTEKEFGAIS